MDDLPDDRHEAIIEFLKELREVQRLRDPDLSPEVREAALVSAWLDFDCEVRPSAEILRMMTLASRRRRSLYEVND